MKLLLCLTLSLTLVLADKEKEKVHGRGDEGKPSHAPTLGHTDAHAKHEHQHHQVDFDRCKGLEMDAVTVNEEGVPYLFKGDHLYKGFQGEPELANETFPEMDDDHQLGHVDAAFHMQHEGSADHHHVYFLLDNKVFSYYQHKMVEGFPKDISAVFPGVPDHLDAAVECPKPDCDRDAVLFFKGGAVYHYDVDTKAVDRKQLDAMPNCTSAFRFMEHYFCFHGHQFSRFHPKTGDVQGRYPKPVLGYFMRCNKFGDDDDKVEREKCSRVHLDAMTSDSAGNVYAFRDHQFISKDDGNDTIAVDNIENAFKELHSDVDAVFSYNDHLYMIKDDLVHVYSVGEPHTHLDSFPKTLKDELGFEGHVDAAFVCGDQQVAHFIQGDKLFDVDMKSSPRRPANERRLALFRRVDAAMCGPGGLVVVVGNHFYRFDGPVSMAAARALPDQHRVSAELFGCDH